MEHDETGCQASLEGPILCVNNCGFFGSAATMNMCSKCHRDILMKQEQANLAAASIGNIESGSSSKTNEHAAVASVDSPINVAVEANVLSGQLPSIASVDSSINVAVEPKVLSGQLPSNCAELGDVFKSKPKEGPNRCTACKKRVCLTGFHCRCGNLFCGVHRYSDKHNCPFDYRTAARDAIAKANPVIKAEKLDKI